MEHHAESCGEVLEQLSDYVDFELPPGACGEVDSHLAGCPECREFVDSLRAVIALFRGHAPGASPRPLNDRARGEIENAWRKMLAARGRPATE